MNEGMYSSKTPEWETPQALFDALDREFSFTLDPCASDENHKCPEYYTERDNGLMHPWSGSVFMNPPYGSHIKHWVEKAYLESRRSEVDVVVRLIPSRTDTRYWHDFIMKASEIRLIKGRVRFSGKDPAPFPSAIVIFNGSQAPLKVISYNWMVDESKY